MDIDELQEQHKHIQIADKNFQKEREKEKSTKKSHIYQTENVTEDKINKRAEELVGLLELKELNNKLDFERKERVLRENYKEALFKLI